MIICSELFFCSSALTLLNKCKQYLEYKGVRIVIFAVKKRAQLSPEMERWKVHICSKNNFPTAAGLASSAAGYACLSAALAKLYKIEV